MEETPPVAGSGWFPDPTGRFDQRYHDGTTWTLKVQRDGVESLDLALASTVNPAGMGSVLPPKTPTDSSLPLGAAVPLTSGAGRVPVAVRRREVDNVGYGTFIGLIGVVTMAAGLMMIEQGTLEAFVSLPTGIVYLAWYGFLVLCTTMRYQPKALAGFIIFGFIGLFVLRGDTDADSKRSNALAAIAIIFVILQYSLTMPADPSTSAKVFLAGQVVVLVGVVVGRKITKTEVFL